MELSKEQTVNKIGLVEQIFDRDIMLNKPQAKLHIAQVPKYYEVYNHEGTLTLISSFWVEFNPRLDNKVFDLGTRDGQCVCLAWTRQVVSSEHAAREEGCEAEFHISPRVPKYHEVYISMRALQQLAFVVGFYPRLYNNTYIPIYGYMDTYIMMFIMMIKKRTYIRYTEYTCISKTSFFFFSFKNRCHVLNVLY